MDTRLLVADSDPILIDIYRRFLSRHGYHVDTALDGRECLDKIHAADVLILEYELQGGGGDSVLARMHCDPLIPDIPVVLVTSEWLSTLVVQPVFECLQKPFGLAEMVDALRAAAACALEIQPA